MSVLFGTPVSFYRYLSAVPPVSCQFPRKMDISILSSGAFHCRYEHETCQHTDGAIAIVITLFFLHKMYNHPTQMAEVRRCCPSFV